MEIRQNGKKWIVIGCDKGWIAERTFPTKWKAVVALDVFKRGGNLKDYWEEARKNRPREVIPRKAIDEIKMLYEKILALKPTPDEIALYGKRNERVRGLVTITPSEGYFPPKIDNTWKKKRGGKVHIDMGSNGYHIMLTRAEGANFLAFVQKIRSPKC